ncbi:hypothetical protein RSAG8_12319, partial [Rhizoctonia solani AG-8 WAC10335]
MLYPLVSILAGVSLCLALAVPAEKALEISKKYGSNDTKLPMFNDHLSIPKSPVLEAVTLRGGDTLNGIDLTFTSGKKEITSYPLTQDSTSLSRPPVSLGPQRNNPTGTKPDKVGPSTNSADSRLAETQTPDPSQQMQQLTLQSNTTAQHNPKEPAAHGKLRARGKSLVWPPGAGGLRAPDLRVPKSPVPEQDAPTEDS